MTDYFGEKDDVLENKLGIEDKDSLKKAEADIVFLRLAELTQKPMQGVFDFAHLKAIHFKLFSDIYTMAGKVRDLDIAKGDSVFCYARFIEPMQLEVFKELKHNKYLQNLSKENFIKKLASLSADLNALHPFLDGNGRTIRFFLTQLASNAGYDVLYENANNDERENADIAGFEGDYKPLETLFAKIVSPITAK